MLLFNVQKRVKLTAGAIHFHRKLPKQKDERGYKKYKKNILFYKVRKVDCVLQSYELFTLLLLCTTLLLLCTAVYSRSMLAGTPWESAGLQYNIFCVHTVWNTKEVKLTLGKRSVVGNLSNGLLSKQSIISAKFTTKIVII